MNGSKRQGRLSRLQDRQLKIDHVKRAESSLSVAFMTAAAVCLAGRTPVDAGHNSAYGKRSQLAVVNRPFHSLTPA
jgi:hypothetical protein